jgi:transcription elongation factor Elf1
MIDVTNSCKLCGNTYLVTRTDVYKDKRAFVYCDCCGAMADSKTWQLTQQPIAAEVPDQMLCSFYQVSTYADLVREMELHIARLQDKLPKGNTIIYQKARVA